MFLTLENFPAHECVPIVLLEDPEVLDDLLHNTPPGLVRVYSCDELERAIEACCRLEFRRRNLTLRDVEAGIDP